MQRSHRARSRRSCCGFTLTRGARATPLTNRYKAIYAAKENIKDEKAKQSYVKNICDLGILGPSIVAYLLCPK